MSGVEKESLFSFEVAVKTVFVKRAVVCRVPSVVVRLLEYPAIELKLVTDDELGKIRDALENDPASIADSPQILQLQHSTGTYAFTQGKSCMIKVKLSELKEGLCTVPVYVMVIDVLPTVPKLVASFALSLESAMRKIVRDVSVNGIERPCAQGERDIFPLYNLMGSKVGEVEMGVRLSSLGINMIQHVSNIVQPESSRPTSASKEMKSSSTLRPTVVPGFTGASLADRSKLKTSGRSDGDDNKENVKLERKVMVSGSTQTVRPKMPSKSVQHPVKTDVEALGSMENVFCPPALYYDKKSDSLERELQQKQQKAVARQLDVSFNESIRLSDLTSDGQEKIASTSSATYSQQLKKSIPTNHTAQTGSSQKNSHQRSIGDFPILRALVAEVARLGLIEEHLTEQQSISEPLPQKPGRQRTKDKQSESRPRNQIFPLHRLPEKQRDRKGPLKFGMTNSMRLRMAMTKAALERQRKENILKTSMTPNSLRQSGMASLGRTYNVKTPRSRVEKRVKMVSKACGPDSSMYRRDLPKNVQQQTVYMGRVGVYEEATDQDIPSMGHMTSDSPALHDPAKADEFGIEDLMIVKDIGTPRAHSRLSQRSIEIHLPTASTEFTIGKDDDWRSTVSDPEKLVEKIKAAEEEAKYDEPGFYTPPESTDTSRPQSVTEIHGAGKEQKVQLTESVEKFPQSEASASDRYRYSDDFEDDKTWSANRTPSATTPVHSTAIKEEDEEEEEYVPVRPSKSMDSTIATTRTSDFESTAEEEDSKHQGELRSVSAQKIVSSDDGVETSSVSRGSVVTALMPAKSSSSKGKMRVGKTSVPEPIPSDSPVIQSINTESGSLENFPDPRKHSLTSKLVQQKKKSSNKKVHLPKTIDEAKRSDWEPPVPKQSRFTPSPPSTRRYSPISSPESSKEKMRRIYHHPGRRMRPTSSGSVSSDFEKPVSPLRQSDSVSSYQPSEISDMSNVRLSEDLDNLSDIPSEDTDSQGTARAKSNSELPADGPKTYFGKPKLDPSSKLGYTT